MKKYNKLSVIIILSIFSISCGNLITPKEKDADSSSNTITGSMKATLDGKNWEAKKVSFGGISALIQANGLIDDNSSISLEFNDNKLEINKVYQFDLKNLEQNLLGNLVVKIDGKALFSQSGTFVIKKYKRNSQIEGEINAEVSNFIDKPISLKNCIFKMDYK